MVALWDREQSGRGQFIDVSAQAALAVTVESANLNWEYERTLNRRQTGRHSAPRPTARTQYVCADGKPINFALPRDDKTWSRLLEYLRGRGLAEGLDEEIFRDPNRRFERGRGDEMPEVCRRFIRRRFHIGQARLHLGRREGARRLARRPSRRTRRLRRGRAPGGRPGFTYPARPTTSRNAWRSAGRRYSGRQRRGPRASWV
jgi:hypothetical protein